MIKDYIDIKKLPDIKVFIGMLGIECFNEFNPKQPFIFGKISFK